MTQQDQRPQECKYCVNNHCQHPYYNDCDCVLWRCNLFTPKTETITQKEIEKAAEEYVITRQQARHNAKREEDATLRDFDKTIKAWDAFDMEQAYEDGANFSLGKQEKDAENTPISERLAPEEKSQLEGIYYYLKRAADKQENESVSVAVLFEVMERLEDIFGIDLLTNGHGKRAPKDADTVIQGWVCRDEDNTLTLFYGSNKPSKEDGDDYWSAVYGNALEYLNQNLFPDVKWEDAEPTKVEIIIKRKKNE